MMTLSFPVLPAARVLMVSVLLAGALSHGANAGIGEGDISEIADFYDGLRAWELKEEATAAAIWLRAAEWGDIRSMERVAELYEQGKVLPQDKSLAYFWFSQATRRGVASAKPAAERLHGQLPPANLSNIESSIDKWRPTSLAPRGLKESKPNSENLFTALDTRDIQSFRTALETSAEYARNAVDPSGTPIIFLAIAINDADFVRALLSKASGPDRNAELRNGMTPIHIAAGLGNRTVVEMLISQQFPTAVQDQNGAWPFELAERKKFNDIAVILRRQLDTDIKKLRTFLERNEYIAAGKFSDQAERERAIKMFQQGERIKSTGYINVQTLKIGDYESGRLSPVPYVLVYTYKKGKHVEGMTLERAFATAEAARSWATEQCRAGGSDCAVDLAPSGGCLAVATLPGEIRVSRPMLSKSEAEADALSKCTATSSRGCSIAKTLCASGL